MTDDWLLRNKEKPKEYRNARYRKKLLYLKLKQSTKGRRMSEIPTPIQNVSEQKNK